MFIIYENVLTNISGAERIYPTDNQGWRIEFEGTIRLGANGKKYMAFGSAEERDRVYSNIVAAYGTDIEGVMVPEPEEPQADDTKKGGRRK